MRKEYSNKNYVFLWQKAFTQNIGPPVQYIGSTPTFLDFDS